MQLKPSDFLLPDGDASLIIRAFSTVISFSSIMDPQRGFNFNSYLCIQTLPVVCGVLMKATINREVSLVFGKCP